MPEVGQETRILFIGDVVGEAGVAMLEQQVPRLRGLHEPHFLVVNAENAALSGENPMHGAGMTPSDLDRLFALGVDVITGGNHSWDGPYAAEVLSRPRVLRPMNYGRAAAGCGAVIVGEPGRRLGVVNLASRTAMAYADTPHDALQAQLRTWQASAEPPDLVLVDLHGESVSEKQIFAFAVAGTVTAVLGTHTHVATLDARLLPGGTAYVSDVGMTGPGGGMQGYAPEIFVEAMRTRLPVRGRSGWADGPMELGAVLVTAVGARAVAIERLNPVADGGGS